MCPKDDLVVLVRRGGEGHDTFSPGPAIPQQEQSITAVANALRNRPPILDQRFQVAPTLRRLGRGSDIGAVTEAELPSLRLGRCAASADDLDCVVATSPSSDAAVE
jgi:hypothetical protein